MEKTCDYKICTGCGVCSTVCPKKCISFFEGDFGHIYPKIDTSVCIDCKKCEHVCPALRDNDKHYPLECHAAFIKNPHDYETTTSGGAAQSLSLLVINDGGDVFGCASLSGANVEHIKVTNREELECLKGSKYVQSNVRKVYKDLRESVKVGKQTLFIGTPCQCAAVKSMFKSVPDNLIIVDLICHGVPSLSFLQNYLKKINVNPTVVNRIQFRTNKGFQLKVFDDNGQLIYSSVPLFEKPAFDSYYGLFFDGLSYRSSCYECQFACPQRCSDITIGDFWGLGRKLPADEIPSHTKGISVILSNTEKGRLYVARLKNLMNLYPRPIEEAIEGNEQLRHPKKNHIRLGVFNGIRKVFGPVAAYRIVSIDGMAKRIIKKIISR